MSRQQKPRTVTGRVALSLYRVVNVVIRERGHDVGVLNEPDVMEMLFMVVAEQAGHQGLEPIDFDNPNGQDALQAIFVALPFDEPRTVRVTPAWRRVVISARTYPIRAIRAALFDDANIVLTRMK